jgi:hypothetical protein
VKRLQGENREDAGHQVEENAAGDGAEDRPENCLETGVADPRAPFGHRSGNGVELEPAVIAERDHAREFAGHGAFPLELGDDPVARPAEALLRRIIHRSVVDWKQVRLADLDRLRDGDGDAQFVARRLEMADADDRTGKGPSPLVEPAALRRPTPNRQIEREFALLRYADLVGAGEPAGIGADRDGAGRSDGHLQPNEHAIVALVDIVHEVSDREPRRHRIAQRSRREARRQLPFHVHRQSGIAGIQPIAVPAWRRTHVDRKLNLASGRSGTFSDQPRLYPTRLAERGHEQEREHDQQSAKHDLRR